jgi:hypothetical protein
MKQDAVRHSTSLGRYVKSVRPQQSDCAPTGGRWRAFVVVSWSDGGEDQVG